MEEASKNGAAGLHRWTKAPTEWNLNSNNSGHTWEILESQQEKWKQIWGATKEQKNPDTMVMRPAGNIEGKKLIEASRSFKTKTAVSYDGLHPRSFSQLCDAGAQVVADLMMIVEMIGVWPRQLRYIVTVLLPKPQEG